ncbi:RES domain protein [Rubripirellula lacrimiformis]|uniref:RES domain protein n=1 Tax=Rubripirellula lacrimiformis TaxID=1930273 RepID=A0A517N518_9BACT|nr:RES domain protein [Rubripirellula lacrimiformis]
MSEKLKLAPLQLNWLIRHVSFEKHVQFQNRFVLDERDREYVQSIVKIANEHCSDAIDSGTEFFRARVHPAQSTATHVPYLGYEYKPTKFPADQMLAPPEQLAKPGRISPAGLPVLYVASDEKTAIAEIRPWVGVECPQFLVQCYESRDWVTEFAVGCFRGGSAATVAEAAHCEANSAGVRPPRPLCGRRWLYV